MSVLQDVAGRYALPLGGQAAEDAEAWHGLYARLAAFSVIGGLVFNALLCLVNTKIMRVADSHVMMSEMTLIGCIFIVALGRRLAPYMLLAVFVSYMLFLFSMRGQPDLKAVRDILIPIGFVFAGRTLHDLKLADRLVFSAAVIVVVMGLFEYLALDVYISFFNVIGYYLARGSVTIDQLYGQTTGLFISGIRPSARTILPFLGMHRVSSVFLEPVSVGNFGAIVYGWCLFRPTMKLRFVTLFLALTVIALGDARFGLYTCILMTLLLPAYRLMPRLVWYVLPFIMLSVLAYYGIQSGTQGGPNDIGGRFQVTAHLLTSLDLRVVFGAQATTQFTADSGLAYTLTKFGIFGFLGLWGLLVFAPVRSVRGRIFHGMVIVYLLLLMIISDSGYSIKTAGLLWFLFGTMSVLDDDALGRKRPDASAGEADALT
jgi:putative polymerase